MRSGHATLRTPGHPRRGEGTPPSHKLANLERLIERNVEDLPLKDIPLSVEENIRERAIIAVKIGVFPRE